MQPSNSSPRVDISVVVPVYNETGNIPEFLKRIQPILEAISPNYEIIFSVDPSSDGTEAMIHAYAQADRRIKQIVFARRIGQPAASLAGIENSSGGAVVVIDVDLQDPPELINDMMAKHKEGYDVVYAKRRTRAGETLIKRAVAAVGYGVIDRISNVEIPRNTGDFRLMSRRVVNELKRFPESHGFLRGLVALVGFKQTEVEFDRVARFSGKGNYNRFFGSIRIGVNGLVAFSSALLNLSMIAGFVSAVVAFLTALVYLGLKIAGTKFPLGNPTIVIVVLLMGGINLMCIGIMGAYVGRIYDEVKRRPRYTVDFKDNFDDLVDVNNSSSEASTLIS